MIQSKVKNDKCYKCQALNGTKYQESPLEINTIRIWRRVVALSSTFLLGLPLSQLDKSQLEGVEEIVSDRMFCIYSCSLNNKLEIQALHVDCFFCPGVTKPTSAYQGVSTEMCVDDN